MPGQRACGQPSCGQSPPRQWPSAGRPASAPTSQGFQPLAAIPWQRFLRNGPYSVALPCPALAPSLTETVFKFTNSRMPSADNSRP